MLHRLRISYALLSVFAASRVLAEHDVGSKATAKEIFGSPAAEPLQVPSLADKKCGKPFVPISEQLKKPKPEEKRDEKGDEKTVAGSQTPPRSTPEPVFVGTPAAAGKPDCGQSH
jgi:hypothetical protein